MQITMGVCVFGGGGAKGKIEQEGKKKENISDI